MYYCCYEFNIGEFCIQKFKILLITYWYTFTFSVLLFLSAKIQSTSHVLLLYSFTIFYFVLVFMEYMIYFQILHKKKHLFGSRKREKMK